jgi:2,4-dienoyl-CoA reductase-like NADH-dependent reductase (Old Yellow Enzyme family)
MNLLREMMQANPTHIESTKSSAPEAFSLSFPKSLRSRFPKTILMLSGGFRSRAGMESALAENACDIIGIERPGVINQHFPKDVLLNEISGEG